MNKQQTFSDIEYANRKRKTKREAFLTMMETIVPWEAFTELVRPHYYAGKRGRPPIGIETMLRMYLGRSRSFLPVLAHDESVVVPKAPI